MRKLSFCLVTLILLSFHGADSCLGQSAWEELIRQNPAAVDDPSIDWQHRLILDVLTLEQARRYYQGTSPEVLVLESGQTLVEYLAARLDPPGNVYVPLAGPCELFQLEGPLSEESLSLRVRGLCGISDKATAVILQLKVESKGGSPRVKLWASDLPEPAEAVVEGNSVAFEDLKATTAVVTLCAEDECTGGELQIKWRDAAVVQAEAVGYFRLIHPADGAGSGSRIMFSTESGNNNFFGTGAGASNGVCDASASPNSCYNAFFGGAAGYWNTTGHGNSFFGSTAGYSNNTGSYNAFFGGSAGENNTTGDSNAFFGYRAGYRNTEGDSNAFFGVAAGTSNTTGADNAFFGRSAGYYNTTGVSNAFFGSGTGYNNTTGGSNAAFGSYSGFSNTTGAANAFFGQAAGYSNTTGLENLFFGTFSGYSNTLENGNTFVGAWSDLGPGPDPGTFPVTNATAIGHRAYVSKSNSLVLGSINGVNGATASTQVGIGITGPERLLHIAGNNAVFRMDRSTNSAAFMLVRTDGGGGILKNFVIGVNASGGNQGEFVINDLGTALGGPGQRRLTIDNDGDVIINGDLITNAGSLSFPDYVFAEDYDLMPLGELRQYVEAQKHLPEIPSATEIQEQGEINVTELQLRLLKKIEELTLYTIEQQETIEHQRAAIELLNSRLEVLETEGAARR